MAALCNRGGPLYFCPVISFYLLSFFPRLISAATDWMSTILLHSACSESVGGPSGTVRAAAAAIPVRWRRRPEVSPPPTTVHQRPIRSLCDVTAATKRRTTSHLTLCGAQFCTLGCFPHPSNYFRWINSTSGLERHPKLNLGQRPLIRYCHSDNLPLFSRIFPAFRTFRVKNGG